MEMVEEQDSSRSPGGASEERATNFTADALQIAGGTFFIQVLLFMTSPIITRLYGPEAYGVYALFLSVTSIFGIVACLQYEDSIMLPESVDEAASLFNLCIVLALVFSIISVPAIVLVKPFLVGFLNAPQIDHYLPLLSLSIFLYGTLLALTTWTSRQKKFGSLSVAKIGGSTTNTAMQLSAGYAGFATSGSLIISSVIGPSITNLILWSKIWRRDKELLKRNFAWSRFKDGLKRYRNFPMYDTWATLLSVLSWQLPILVFAAFFSPSNVGFYALGMTAVGIPSELIATAVSQVFFQRASVAHRVGNLPIVVESLVLRLVAIGVLPFLMLIIIGPYLFDIFFGQAWGTAGTYAGILAPWMLLVFITSPMGMLFSVFERQRSSLALNALFFPLRMGALLIGGLIGDPVVALILYSLASVICYGTILTFLLRWSKVSVRVLARDMRPTLAYAASFLGVVAFAAYILRLGPLEVLATGIALVLFYYVLILRRDELLRDQVKSVVMGIIGRTRSEGHEEV